MGRYLQPEPYLQNPWFVQGRAAAGMSTPVYAYAQNNPVTGFDENGLADRKECPVKKGTIVISELGTSCGGTCMVSNFDKLTEDEKCKECQRVANEAFGQRNTCASELKRKCTQLYKCKFDQAQNDNQCRQDRPT